MNQRRAGKMTLKKGKHRIVDPVCGMTVRNKNSAPTFSYHGLDYHFCSERCRAIFEEHPEAVVVMKVAREEVVEEEKAESLDDMTDQLVHEIRNPLITPCIARRILSSE